MEGSLGSRICNQAVQNNGDRSCSFMHLMSLAYLGFLTDSDDVCYLHIHASVSYVHCVSAQNEDN